MGDSHASARLPSLDYHKSHYHRHSYVNPSMRPTGIRCCMECQEVEEIRPEGAGMVEGLEVRTALLDIHSP